MIFLIQGANTQTQGENGPNFFAGLHEPMEWYDKCKTRTRNKGMRNKKYSVVAV